MSGLVGGIDFSGTPVPGATWAARGEIRDGRLVVDRLAGIGRDGVAPLIRASGPAAWGLDFPFGLPAEFLAYLADRHGAPVDTWAEYAGWLPGLTYPGFVAARDAFCVGRGEPRRDTDRLFPSAFSCLHKANPNLLPMTFRGIGLLSDLAAECAVNPFTTRGDRRLHEIYPGGTLRALGLPARGYKQGSTWAETREAILRRLASLPALPVALTPDQQRDCLANDNALDAVVACLTAALVLERPRWFRAPPAGPGEWQREGWIWAPSPDRHA